MISAHDIPAGIVGDVQTGTVPLLGHGTHPTEGAVQRIVGTAEAHLGNEGCVDTGLTGTANVESLHSGHVLDHLVVAAGAGGSSSHCSRHMLQIKLQCSSHCHGSANGTQSTGGLETTCAVCRLQGAAQTNAGFIADDDTTDQIVHGQVKPLAHCQQGRNGGGSQMHGAETMAVVQFQNVTEHTVDHTGVLQGCLTAAHTHQSNAVHNRRLHIQILGELRLQHSAAAQNGAQEVQQAQACLTDNFCGEFAVCQLVQRTGKHICQVLRHCMTSLSLNAITAQRKPYEARSSSRDALQQRERRWRAEDQPS